MPCDAFARHPELRGLITDPDQSAMRGFDPQAFAAARPELHLEVFLTPPAKREASRKTALATCEGDLWVFGYGSLMWDPAFRFNALHRGYVADHARRFILKDTFGARGTADRPGLLAALDQGAGCEGLVFRIAAAEREAETQILWRREMAGPAYHATFLTVDLGDQTVRALAFTADHASPVIISDISREDQVRFIATGTGAFGSSLEYLTNIAAHFAALGIEDRDVTALMHETRAYLARYPQTAAHPIDDNGGTR